jgi:hypothetical protein
MSSTVFSISLNALDMAKLGEIQKNYPNLSRNGAIRHIINLANSIEFDTREEHTEQIQYLENQVKDLAKRIAELVK